VSAGIGKMQTHLARVPIDHLAVLPECTDAEKIVALRLLCHVVPLAERVDPALSVLAELIAFDLMLTFGTTAVCAKVLVELTKVQCTEIGDYSAGYRLGKVAFRLLERYEARPLYGQVHFVFAACVSHWGGPYAEALHSFEESRRCSTEAGDHEHLACCEALYPRLLLTLGRHLRECAAAARAGRALLERIRARERLDAIGLCQLAITQLSAPERTGDSPDLDQLTRDILGRGDRERALQHGQMQMLVHVVLGDWDEAVRWSEFTRPYLEAAPVLFIIPEYHLLECLITTQCRWPRSSDAERPQLLAELERHADRLRRWRDLCPENFAHKWLLAAAEVARVKGESPGAVVALYEQAIETSRQQFLHLRALGSELYGQFLLGLGRGRLAEPLSSDALALYSRWGAEAKVRRLKAELESCFPRARDSRGATPSQPSSEAGSRSGPGADTGALDLASVLRSTRAISSEVTSERVFAAVMSAVLEHAPAQRACLVLQHEGDQSLYVRARTNLRASGHAVIVRQPLEDEAPVCQQVVRSVARSLEPVMLDDAGTLSSAPPALDDGAKSVLCLPVVDGSRLLGVLYVENVVATCAFTRGHAKALRWIADQAGISLANAARYEGLERLAQIVDAGIEDVKSFCETARRSLAVHVAAAARGSLDPERRRALSRDVHSIERHARSLGLEGIVAVAHAAQETGALDSAAPAGALAALNEIAAAIENYEQIGERKLGRLWSLAGARFQQALGAIESALAERPERPSYPVRARTQVKQVVHRRSAIPLDQVLRETSRLFPSLARELGKSVPDVEWVDDGTLLDAEWGRVMKDALVHTFRNSLDHGIETREEREALGKAPRGKIAVFTERDDHGVRIHLRDDGRGLPIAELRNKTGRLDGSDQAIAEAIFDYGVSNASQLSHVSGRGIGMDAIRGVLRERGGDVAIAFTGDARAGYRPFELVFSLPNDAMIAP
jgi:GAF domain-containing protein